MCTDAVVTDNQERPNGLFHDDNRFPVIVVVAPRLVVVIAKSTANAKGVPEYNKA